MPLFRIESDSESEPDADSDAPSRRRARPAGRDAPAASSDGRGMLPVVAGVLVFMLLVMAGVAAFVTVRGAGSGTSQTAAGADESGAALSSPAAPSTGAAETAGMAGDPAATAAAATAVVAARAPLNADYPREEVIATVNGVPFRMGQLESAVRVARVLAALTGQPAPDYGTPEMKELQIELLRRQVDMLLIKQAMERQEIPLPGQGVADSIESFLEKEGKTVEQLEAEMAANEVTWEELERWFRDARAVNFFIDNVLLPESESEDRLTVVQAWLQQEWQEQNISITFYDPETGALP